MTTCTSAHFIHNSVTGLKCCSMDVFLDDCKSLILISSKTEFLLTGIKKQLVKIYNSSLYTTHSACNLGFMFDEQVTFSDQISSFSKSCYYHICQLCCIRPYLDSTTACTIATSMVHSKLHYCNSTTTSPSLK